MKNPKWQRDEIILALDLYFESNRGSIDDKNPKIVELSEVLNRLPIHTNRPNVEKFRNPNGVTLKLSNFLAIDPNYSGKGMTAFSKLDKEVFEEFQNDRIRLRDIATQLIAISNDKPLTNELSKINDDDCSESMKEGKILYKVHKIRERDKRLVERKKDRFKKEHGRLFCEICEFDFKKIYGKIGDGFIECHHKTPLKSLTVESETRVDDLILVCSNCHRMLHRMINEITVEELRSCIQISYHWQ